MGAGAHHILSVRRIPEFHDRAPDLNLQKLDKVVQRIEAFVLDPNDPCAVQTRSATPGPGKFTAKALHTEAVEGATETPASYIGVACRMRIDSHEEIVDHFNRCAHIPAPPRRLAV